MMKITAQLVTNAIVSKTEYEQYKNQLNAGGIHAHSYTAVFIDVSLAEAQGILSTIKVSFHDHSEIQDNSDYFIERDKLFIKVHLMDHQDFTSEKEILKTLAILERKFFYTPELQKFCGYIELNTYVWDLVDSEGFPKAIPVTHVNTECFPVADPNSNLWPESKYNVLESSKARSIALKNEFRKERLFRHWFSQNWASPTD